MNLRLRRLLAAASAAACLNAWAAACSTDEAAALAQVVATPSPRRTRVAEV